MVEPTPSPALRETPPPPTGTPAGEARQVRLLRALLLGAAAVQALNVAYITARPDLAYRIGPSRMGLGIAALLAVFALWPRVGLRALQGVVVGGLGTWFVLNVAGVVVTQRPTASGLLLQLVVVALLAFTWWPVRRATGLVTVMYALLLVACVRSGRPDVPGTALTGVILPLIWYLTQHGQALRHERDHRAALQALASTDPLTGLLNRRAGMERLQALAAAPGADGVLVALVDLDHFKQVNDVFGHVQGDHVLAGMARVLQDAVQAGDVLARWGGEEFLLALPGPPADARQRAEWALHAVRQARLPGGGPGRALTVSGGCAFLGESGSISAVLELADRRLYRAKAAGRDQLVDAGP